VRKIENFKYFRYLLLCARGLPETTHSESVRFLGRRVYAGLVVVLITVMIHGLQPARVGRIRETLQIDSRTLKRWRQCWLDNFVRSGKRSMLCTNKLYLTPY
jgi:hypothetical protein